MGSYKVYKFDGTEFQQLPSIPADIISTYTSLNTPFLIPVPNKDSTSPAAWGLISLGDGKLQPYNFTGGNTLNTQPKIFQTNRPYILFSTTPEEPRTSPITKSTTFGMLLGVAAFGLLMSVYGMFVYRRNRRAETLRALEGGVSREAYGEDACDSLPRYTPRAHTADHSGFFDGMFHGRATRPPSYKTTLSVNLSRSATRATMLASPSNSLTDPATEMELYEIFATAAVDEAVTPERSEFVSAAPESTTVSASMTSAAVDSITTTPLESSELSTTSTNTATSGDS